MGDIFDGFPIIRGGEADSTNISDGEDRYVPYDGSCGTERDIARTLQGSDEVVTDAEVICSDEAEVIRDYPDSSADVDIELKYKRFIDYFLICGNKSKAAKLAGFNASTADSLKAQACKAFKRPEVQEYYLLKKEELAAKADISYEAYMTELVSIATLDIRDVVETEVVPTLTNETIYSFHFKNVEDIPDAARKAIKSIEIAKDGSPKMVFYDKLAALKMLGVIKGYIIPKADDGDEDTSGIAMIPGVLPVPDEVDAVGGK